jgi:hypothetical protein
MRLAAHASGVFSALVLACHKTEREAAQHWHAEPPSGHTSEPCPQIAFFGVNERYGDVSPINQSLDKKAYIQPAADALGLLV